MTHRGDTHRVGRPLGVDAARVRAEQAAVLGDTLVLRVLSAIAARTPDDEIPEALHASVLGVSDAIARLEDGGIIGVDERGERTLTADAWVRFGRLLATGSPALPVVSPDVPLTALPDAIESIARDLSYRFSSTFSAETVSRYVAESYALISRRARVRAHLPTLTARYAADRLDALASANGLVLRDTPEVLFVCVQNSGRSQMAAAYLRYLAGAAVHVRTAGSDPAGEMDERIVRSLAEVGVPFGDEYPKPLTDEVVQAADYVVTMGCGDACPVYPGRRYMDWDLEDPLLLDDTGIARVRDQVRARVEGLIRDMRLIRASGPRVSDSV